MAKRKTARGADTFETLFIALAHPVRRRILHTIYFQGGSMTAGEIAGLFAHAWPTTTRHLQVLVGSGLLEQEKWGRERLYRLDQTRLKLARDWIDVFFTKPK